MNRLAIVVLTLALLLIPSSVFAAEELAGSGWDVFAMLYTFAGGILLGLFSWLSSKLGGWLEEKKKNEWWGGALARFNTALMDGLSAAHAKLKANIETARSADSPGGMKITKFEKDQMAAEMWDFLKDRYGGISGLQSALGVLVGGDIEKWVNAKIEGALGGLEASTTSDPS